MTGIRISSNKKRLLYPKYRMSNDNNLKFYYKWYCKILSEVSKAAETTTIWYNDFDL